ncbi:nucleotide exchange factor GrpE [Radiobacillus sp. PE A8.2]|uniref:nucleotide exchange factor GrpE n=1 Tax=Radiobacillus sp. PE A8.2 TaxID=3380349 RepID=UPI00388CEEA9
MEEKENLHKTEAAENDQAQDIVEEPEQELVDEVEQDDEEITSEPTELELLQQEKDEIYQRLLRIQAEYDNFRKRTQREKEADRKYKSQSLITELLPVLDNFERALSVEVKEDSLNGFIEGINMVYRQFSDALTKEGVEEIKTEGETFDPHLHQAVMMVEEEGYDSNVVVEELQKGYQLKDRVIRPAMVKVNG